MGWLLSGHPSIMGARLSFLLGLRGTALFVDTACSSGMVAVDLATQSVKQRRSSSGLGLGVALQFGPALALGPGMVGMKG